MPGVTGDIVQVTLTGSVLGELMENVHFYRVEDEPSAGYLEGLLTEFQTEVLPAYATVQHDEVLYTRLTARNIFDFDEFVLTPLTPDQGSGTTSDPVPSFVAASIQLTRSNARVRNGRKSIAGAMEGQMISQVWDSGYLTNLQALADAFVLDLNPGLVDLFKPVIVGRVFVPADPPDIPRAYYRLPASQAEMDNRWAYVVSALASPDVSTQNLRKKGHGA